MTKKRSRNPELRAFGAWLEARRGRATREQISIKLATLGAPLGGSTLAQYEKGTVWAPDACVLWGLARIYRYPLEQIIELLKANRADPTLDAFDTETLAPAVPSVQPEPDPHAENRAVSTDSATITATLGELRAALRDARELANQFRRAASAAIVQTARGQAPSPRVVGTRQRPAARKRRG